MPLKRTNKSNYSKSPPSRQISLCDAHESKLIYDARLVQLETHGIGQKEITRLETRTALTVPAPSLGISRIFTTSTVKPKKPPIHCHQGPSRNANLILIPLNPRDHISVNTKQHRVPTKKDCNEEKPGLLPGLRALRALTPPCVAKAMPPIITSMPPTHGQTCGIRGSYQRTIAKVRHRKTSTDPVYKLEA